MNEDRVKGKVKEGDAKDMGEDLVDEAKDRLDRDDGTSDDAARHAERA